MKNPDVATEMEALRGRLAALEASMAGRLPGSRPARKLMPRRSARTFALLTSGAVLVGATVVYAQIGVEALFISKEGNVGIGSVPTQKLDVAGTIRSSSGGFQFPDGTLQTTAAMPAGAVVAFNLSVCPTGWAMYAPAFGRFIRGIDRSGNAIDPSGNRAAGSTQEDAIRNITGSINGVSGGSYQAWGWGFRPGTTGAFDVPYGFATYNKYNGDYTPSGGVGTTANLDASRVVPTAPDNRPKNVALLYCLKN